MYRRECGGAEGKQAAKAHQCEVWWQRLAIRRQGWAAPPVMDCVVTSPLLPSVKWDHVLPRLPRRAVVRESGEESEALPTIKKMIVLWGILGGWSDKVRGRTFIPSRGRNEGHSRISTAGYLIIVSLTWKTVFLLKKRRG